MAEPHYGTKFDMGNGIRSNSIRLARTVTQYGNATISLWSYGYPGFTTTQIGSSVGSSVDNFSTVGSPTIVINEEPIVVTSASTDYGFFITNTNNSIDLNNGTWDSGALYWGTVEPNVGGTAADSNQVVVADLTGLIVGMELIFTNQATSAQPGDTTTVTAIDTATKTLTLSRNQAITGGHTMVFAAYGPRLIKEATGIGLKLTNPTVKLGQVTTTIHAQLTSDIAEGSDIEIKSTQGIGKGATIRMRGLKKNSESGACVVGSVDGSTSQGSITLTNGEIEASSGRPVRAGTKIYVDGSSNLIYLSGTITINKYPTALGTRYRATSQPIYIDMHKILTAGTNT